MYDRINSKTLNLHCSVIIAHCNYKENSLQGLTWDLRRGEYLVKMLKEIWSLILQHSSPRRFSQAQLIGSFSIDNGNGSENVSFKMNSRFFNLCGVYSNLLKMASVGEFPWSWFPEDLTQVYVLHKTCNYAFSRRSRARTVKKCTKKRDARAKLLFC